MKNGRDKQDNNHYIEQTRRKDGYKSRTLTTSYTLTDADKIRTLWCTTGASDIDVTLPLSENNLDRTIDAVKIDSGAGDVVLKGNVSGTTTQLISGNLTTSVIGQYSKMSVKSDGNNWYIMVVT